MPRAILGCIISTMFFSFVCSWCDDRQRERWRKTAYREDYQKSHNMNRSRSPCHSSPATARTAATATHAGPHVGPNQGPTLVRQHRSRRGDPRWTPRASATTTRQGSTRYRPQHRRFIRVTHTESAERQSHDHLTLELTSLSTSRMLCIHIYTFRSYCIVSYAICRPGKQTYFTHSDVQCSLLFRRVLTIQVKILSCIVKLKIPSSEQYFGHHCIIRGPIQFSFFLRWDGKKFWTPQRQFESLAGKTF